jgi:hypothetical protein
MHKNKAMEALERLFWLFPQSGDETERSARFAAYWEVLSPLPSACIAMACALAASGKVGNPAFLPSAAELFTVAEKLAARNANPRPRLQKPGQVELPAVERERRVAILQKLKSQIQAATAAMESPFISMPRPGLAAHAGSFDPVRLSDEAKKICGSME